MSSAGLRTRIALAAAAAALVAAGVLLWGTGGGLVVYCAHDRVYSEEVLAKFTEETGIAVSPRFDTEATKSLGLVEQIAREAAAPRCDVFWNNEVLGTMDLARRGLLEPYAGRGHTRIPEQYRDPGGLWTGFAARMRVWIVNTDKVKPTREAVRSRVAGDLSRVAVARPLFGTTLTHYCVLSDLWGLDALKAWHRQWRARGVREVPGNSTVKDLVADGTLDLGLTDTDDFFLAKDAGSPVAMVPFRTGDIGAGPTNGSRPPDRVILIPNTVAVVKGTRRPDDAKRLVDWLLSEETELALARSRARQIPLGEVDAGELPADVAALAALVGEGYPLGGLTPAREACIEWLKAER
ncbi:MAG: extracellular solute-binding protein [Planctomycetota bacterium]